MFNLLLNHLNTVLAVVAIGGGVVGILSIFIDLVGRDRRRVSNRLTEEFHQQQRTEVEHSIVFKDPEQVTAELARQLDDQQSLRWRFETMVEQSGLKIKPVQLLLLCAAVGLAFGLSLQFITGSWLIAVMATGIAGSFPIVYVAKARRSRIERMRGQLPEVFDLLARIIRSGHSLMQAIQSVSQELAAPVAAEFSYCYEQQKLGLPPDDALRDLARRTNVMELKLFSMAVIVQRQSGGNLTELLDQLAMMVRERFRIQGIVRSLTSEGRFQAIILLVLPILLLFAMLLINWDYSSFLLKHPKILVVMGAGEGLGYLWIRKIVNFDF